MPGREIAIIALFVVTYLLIIRFYHRKSYVVWGSVLILLLSAILTPLQALEAIDWNVILLYVGMLFVSEVFLWSKMPDYLATIVASKAKRVGIAMLAICFMSGLLSIFLENVAVVLLVAPVALSISKKCGINPVPLFIGIAISSNLQGAATLIGDPPSMLLAGFADMNFNDFFFINGKPGMFFAVQIGSIVSLFVLHYFFRKYHQPMPQLKKETYLSLVPSFLVLFLIAALIISSVVPHSVSYMTGLLCVIFGVAGFLWYAARTKGKDTKEFIKRLDWDTGLFLIGIFILVRSLAVSGILEDIAQGILGIGAGNTFLIYMMIIGISVVLSAFIDNVPFLVAMLPVVQIISDKLGASPYLFFFGLLLGASIGGNITPVGASANIVAMGIMKKKGYHPSFMEFVRMGLPFTLCSVLASSLFIWMMFS